MKIICRAIVLLIPLIGGTMLAAEGGEHTFSLGTSEFLLDGKPFQIISGELHPARIPREYWRHRIQMARAMGCNTIAAYVFWNYHETRPGTYDFSSGNRDIPRFLRIAAEEKMWVLLRPGPYVCAEWDFGGIPPFLLAVPDLKIRCMDSRYMEAVERYVTALANVVRPHLITNGGPVVMLQIENEYGSYGNDKRYLERLRDLWRNHGVDVPFYTADGATPYMLEAGTLDSAAIGLDPGSNEQAFAEAARHNPNVPAFSSETYPGWLTHWGEEWARPDTGELYREVRYLMERKRSFNLYVIHGGTNFGFTAGANSGGKGYEPDLTSYDYDAPINEQGRPTHKYAALRKLIGNTVQSLPDPPPLIPAIDIPPITMEPFSTIWVNLPAPVNSVQPRPMEAYGQQQGFILYRTQLIGHKSGTLRIVDPHDYAVVFLNGIFVGTVDRRRGERTIELPTSAVRNPILEVFVEAMGRINYGAEMIDRKGITDRVTLNGMTLMNWDVYTLPFDESFMGNLKSAPVDTSRRGVFFRGSFSLTEPADTYIDMSQYQKGLAWVNGHNLGRYWNIGPQQRLYCPGPWLRKGKNEIIIFDLLQNRARPVSGHQKL